MAKEMWRVEKSSKEKEKEPTHIQLSTFWAKGDYDFHDGTLITSCQLHLAGKSIQLKVNLKCSQSNKRNKSAPSSRSSSSNSKESTSWAKAQSMQQFELSQLHLDSLQVTACHIHPHCLYHNPRYTQSCTGNSSSKKKKKGTFLVVITIYPPLLASECWHSPREVKITIETNKYDNTCGMVRCGCRSTICLLTRDVKDESPLAWHFFDDGWSSLEWPCG